MILRIILFITFTLTLLTQAMPRAEGEHDTTVMTAPEFVKTFNDEAVFIEGVNESRSAALTEEYLEEFPDRFRTRHVVSIFKGLQQFEIKEPNFMHQQTCSYRSFKPFLRDTDRFRNMLPILSKLGPKVFGGIFLDNLRAYGRVFINQSWRESSERMFELMQVLSDFDQEKLSRSQNPIAYCLKLKKLFFTDSGEGVAYSSSTIPSHLFCCLKNVFSVPEEKLHPVIDDLLGDYRPNYFGLQRVNGQDVDFFVKVLLNVAGERVEQHSEIKQRFETLKATQRDCIEGKELSLWEYGHLLHQAHQLNDDGLVVATGFVQMFKQHHVKANKILFLPTDRYIPGVLGEVRKMLNDLKTKGRYQRRRAVYEKRMFELLDKEDLEAEKISCGLICAYTALTEKMVTIYDRIAYKVPPLVLQALLFIDPKFYYYLETFCDENTAFFRMIGPEAFNRFVRDFHSDWGSVADMKAALEAKQKEELDRRASEAAICTIL